MNGYSLFYFYFCSFNFLSQIWISSLLYNIVDIAAFSVPMAGSINQLLMSGQNDPDTTPQGPHSWIFSVSAVVIFFHLVSLMKRFCIFACFLNNISLLPLCLFSNTAPLFYERRTL